MKLARFWSPRRGGLLALAGGALTGVAPALALAGVAAALYRWPLAATRSVLRRMLLLSGASERTVDVDGLPVRYFEAIPRNGGEETTFVLVHGLGDSAETWALVMPALAGEGRVLAPDLAGFGRTRMPREGMRFSALTKYLAGFLDAIGVERAVLVGNSLGGAVILRYAATHPDRVAGLFLLDSGGLLDGVPPALDPATREEARELVEMTSGPGAQAPNFVLDDLVRRAQSPAYQAYLHSDEPTDISEDLGRIQAPTTLIWGEHDRLVPPDHGAAMQQEIKGSELILLPDASHLPHLQAPREVLDIIRDQIRRPGRW